MCVDVCNNTSSMCSSHNHHICLNSRRSRLEAGDIPGSQSINARSRINTGCQLWVWRFNVYLALGQAKYIYSLASVPACLLASPLQADLAEIRGGVALIWGRSKVLGVWFNHVNNH